jgi:hypothetical protein
MPTINEQLINEDGIGYIKNGVIILGDTDNGRCYKNPSQFRCNSNEVCYQSEGGQCYTYSDILDICDNNELKAGVCFELCDWQCIEAMSEELNNDGELGY